MIEVIRIGRAEIFKAHFAPYGFTVRFLTVWFITLQCGSDSQSHHVGKGHIVLQLYNHAQFRFLWIFLDIKYKLE